jgi:hypothetical protein
MAGYEVAPWEFVGQEEGLLASYFRRSSRWQDNAPERLGQPLCRLERRFEETNPAVRAESSQTPKFSRWRRFHEASFAPQILRSRRL